MNKLEGYNEDNDNEDFVIYSGEPYIGDINGNKIEMIVIVILVYVFSYIKYIY